MRRRAGRFDGRSGRDVRRLCAILAACAVGPFAAPALAANPAVDSGRRIAQRDCGECHAVIGSNSPLPAAPPFNTLQSRLGVDGLHRALQSGMLAGGQAELEEGRRPGHPRMPRVKLDGDEFVALTAFLDSLTPQRRAPR